MSLKVATRLWLGFWTPLGALALIGVLVGWYVVLVDDAFDEIARVEEPTGAAADETEINVIGSSMAVLRYVETGDPRYRRRVENGRTTLDRFKRQYHRLAQTAREQELGRRLALIDDEIQGVTHQGLEAAIGSGGLATPGFGFRQRQRQP